MTTLRVHFSKHYDCDDMINAISRIDGCVCVDGSLLTYHPLADGSVDVRTLTLAARDGRTDLTPTEIATFVRNYFDEGHDDEIRITEM